MNFRANADKLVVHRSTPVTPARAGGLACAALALTLLAPPAGASRYWNHDAAAGNLVDVQVLVQGQSAPLYGRWDQRDRFYFQAFKGRNYALSLHNRTGERIAVLVAVDGLNVVSGARSSLTAGESMYVLGPWETAVIRGWRTSLDDVRQFVFVDEERSYAQRTGQANGDMGWIRVLSFRENRPLAWLDPLMRAKDPEPSARRPECGDGSEAPSAPEAQAGRKAVERDDATRSEARAQNEAAPRASGSFPGTGWGEQRNDPVRRVEFNPERHASDQLVLRYEYEGGLRALGILPSRGIRLEERERGQLGFAQPPSW